MESFTISGLKVKIEADDVPLHPRTDYVNLGKMVCFHNEYNLGDETRNDISPTEYLANLMSEREYREHKKYVDKDKLSMLHINNYLEKHFIILPLYLYDHSGLSISTSPFSCGWDSGQVGFIFVEKGDETRLYDSEETIKETLQSEVKIYNQYLEGDVYGYTITDENDNVLHSCWGFYGFNYCKDEATSEAKNIAKDLSTDYVI